MKKWTILVIFAALALILAACGGDDDNDSDTRPTATEAATAEAAEADGAPSLDAAPDLGGGPDLAGGLSGGPGDERQLPGCSDPDSDECPAPLDMPLDGEASFEGVSINYPSRYFDAAVGDETGGDALIAITPSEKPLRGTGDLPGVFRRISGCRAGRSGRSGHGRVDGWGAGRHHRRGARRRAGGRSRPRRSARLPCRTGARSC